MEAQFSKAADEAAAFQKIWLETMSKMAQVAVTISPNSPPPDVVRQLRGGMLQVLAASWDEFMRSPKFLEGSRQWLDNALAFRKLSNDFMGRVRTELQAPSRADIDSIMLTVRHMEQRLLNRLDDLAGQVGALERGGRRSSEAGERRGQRTPAAKRPSAKHENSKVQTV